MPSGLTPLELELTDHLTAAALGRSLAPLTQQLASGSGVFTLLVDCRRMTGYDGDARALFVSWNHERRASIGRVAVVTDNLLWHMVVSAMSLAARQSMRAFGDVDEARRWLDRE